MTAGERSGPGRESGRERVLETAYRLFSQHGTRAVGVDRIIAESGVAKMTLYRNFASKDDLILAFLELREERWTRAWLQDTVRERAATHRPWRGTFRDRRRRTCVPRRDSSRPGPSTASSAFACRSCMPSAASVKQRGAAYSKTLTARLANVEDDHEPHTTSEMTDAVTTANTVRLFSREPEITLVAYPRIG